jgi:Uncharacterized protein conserved in bacteria
VRRIVAAGLVAAGFLGASATAQARPTIYVIEPGSPTGGARPALGLYVPGAGGTVSRAGTIAALRRGKVENAALGGRASGKILADVVFGVPDNPVEPAAYVTLPPSGTHPNTTRYLVAIAGAGYHGILTSDSTRIRGLVSVADIAPTLVALEAGRSPPINSEADADAQQDLRELDKRLTRVHHDRGWVTVVVVFTMLLLIASHHVQPCSPAPRR